MTLFYLHVRNGLDITLDEDGIELEGVTAARARAIEGIRSIVSQEIQGGILDLCSEVIITNRQGDNLLVVHFRDAFDVSVETVRSTMKAPSNRRLAWH